MIKNNGDMRPLTDSEVGQALSGAVKTSLVAGATVACLAGPAAGGVAAVAGFFAGGINVERKLRRRMRAPEPR